MLYYSISVKTYKVQLLPDFVALVIWNFGGVVDIFNRHFADRFWRNSEWNKAAQNRSKYVANRNPCRNGWGGKVITKYAAFILIGLKENEVSFWLVEKILPSFFHFFICRPQRLPLFDCHHPIKRVILDILRFLPFSRRYYTVNHTDRRFNHIRKCKDNFEW